MMFFYESFVPHGEEFYEVNCKVDDEGVNLCPFVVYDEGSRFRNVDPKKFEHVMNEDVEIPSISKLGLKRPFEISKSIVGLLLSSTSFICQTRKM